MLMHKNNDELFNIYYVIFYELWTFADFDRLCKLEKREDAIKKKSSLKLLYSSNLALSGLKYSSFGHLKKFLFLVMAAILDTGRLWRTPFQNCVRQRRPLSKMAPITKNKNFFKWPKLLYVKEHRWHVCYIGLLVSEEKILKHFSHRVLC
jgi:hypothetical protein